MNTTETILWGVREGNEAWQEEILSTNPVRFDEIKALAARDGFGKFRIGTVDLSTAPDFRSARIFARKSKRQPKKYNRPTQFREFGLRTLSTQSTTGAHT